MLEKSERLKQDDEEKKYYLDIDEATNVKNVNGKKA